MLAPNVHVYAYMHDNRVYIDYCTSTLYIIYMGPLNVYQSLLSVAFVAESPPLLGLSAVPNQWPPQITIPRVW